MGILINWRVAGMSKNVTSCWAYANFESVQLGKLLKVCCKSVEAGCYLSVL